MKQTILVTGASSGFGLLIANKLHQSGYHVIGTSRNPQILTLQRFAYNVFENSVLKGVNAAK